MDWAAFRRSKAYDLLMAAPLILWFGWNALAARPALMGLSFALMDRPRATTALALTAVVVAILFDLLLVWSLLARAPVVRRATGLLPRLCAVAGTFIGVGMWLATVMFFNVWVFIWPAQKIALGMVEADADAKARAGRTATLFSRTNTLLSLPMLATMTMNQTIFG